MRYAWRLLAGTTLLITGCSVSSIATKTPAPVPAPDPSASAATSISGILHGGRQPIVGAKVYIYAVTIGAYNQPSTSLMLGTSNTHQDASGDPFYVLTDSGGAFHIMAHDYSCTSSGETAVYLYSQGGNPGTSSANPNAGLMAVLGACSAATSSTGGAFPSVHGSVVMNEVTTVATAYALAGFAIDPTHMSGGTTSEGATAVGNAANNAFNLASLTTLVGGTNALTQTPGNPNSVVPQAEINTLADALAACVNEITNGCTKLFTDTTGNQNDDTANAAIYIAHRPQTNVSAIYGLTAGSTPFQPILSGGVGFSPNDWTIAITYTSPDQNGVSMVAIDAGGNVWVTNNDASTITKFSPAGAKLFTTLSGAGGVSGPFGIAVDTDNNIWVANTAGSSISEFDNNGNSLLATTSQAGGLMSPWGIAFDANGNAWIANEGNSKVSEYVPGTGFSGNGFSGGGLNDPIGIAVDHDGMVWVANTAGDGSATDITQFNSSTHQFVSPSDGYSGGGLMGPVGIAVDHAGNVWAANEFNNVVTEYSPSSGFSLDPDGYGGGGLSATANLAASDGIAIDGNSNVWVANHGPISNTTISNVSEFNSSGAAISGSKGYQFGNLNGAQGIAVDGSGNVWIADNGTTEITEIVGAATPVVTPIAAAVKSSLGTPP